MVLIIFINLLFYIVFIRELDMKIRFTLIILVVLLSIAACGSNSPKPEITMIPCQVQDSLWGFADINGNIVIKPVFETEPTYFREGFAVIRKKNGKFDYIDQAGKLMNKDYLYATYFSEGLALVVEENKSPVFVDKEFKTVLEMNNYQEVAAFSDGMARFKLYNQMWGFINASGDVVLPPVYDHAESFSEGLALIEAKDSGLVPYKAFIDTKGKIIAKLDYEKYAKIRYFSDGMAAFFDGNGWGFFDKTGAIAVKPVLEWSAVTDYKNGYASVCVNGQWGVIDKTGAFVIKPSLLNPCMFYNNLGAMMKDNKVGFIDLQGNELIKPQFDDLVLPFLGENAIVKQGNDFIFINKEGKPTGNAKMKTVGRNFFYVYGIGDVVRNDYFDTDRILATLFPAMTPNSICNLSANADFDQVVNKAGLTGQLKFNAFDSTWVITKPGSVENFLDYSINYKFRAEGTKYKLRSIVFTLKLNLGFQEKIVPIKDAVLARLSANEFKVVKEERTIVVENPNAVCSFDMLGQRMVFRYDFK